MKRLRGFGDRTAYRGCYLSIGNFDGVHRGHQAILSRLVELARSSGVPAVALTFEPHPFSLLRPQHAPPRLTTADHKAKLIAAAGVDVILEYPTDWALLNLTPSEFFQRVVVDEFQTRGLVEGPNFFFGKDRAGTVETLRALCEGAGPSLEIVQPTIINDEIVSSSRIRQALLQGDVALTTTLLGRRYCLRGLVSAGAARGRTLGFPTANLEQIETMLPAEGVYAAWCQTASERLMAAVNVGSNPTFGDRTSKVEAYLLEFAGHLYAQEIELELVERVRPVQSFPTPQQLQTQIQEDVALVKKILLRNG